MKKKHLILLIALISLFSSCTCLHREKARIQFTEAQKQLIPPYEQDSVVSFIDQNGNLIDFTVAEIEKWWHEMDIDYGAMCSDYAVFETERITLKSPSNDCELKVSIGLNTSDFDQNGKNVLTWDGSCCIEIVYSSPDECWNVWMNADKSGVFSTNDHTFFYEDIELNNHVYHDVIETTHTCTKDTQEISIGLLYNKDYGIIQMKMFNKNILTLSH